MAIKFDENIKLLLQLDVRKRTLYPLDFENPFFLHSQV